MNALQREFEKWVIAHKSSFMLDKSDHPSLWGAATVEMKEWSANPYSHPWTAGAYEAWKFKHNEMNKGKK